VFRSGVPLVVAPLDATTSLKLEEARRNRLFGTGTPLTWQLQALYQLWDQPTPTLFDPVAAALCFEEKFCTLEPLRLEVDHRGFPRPVKGKPNARVATSIRRPEFLSWLVKRLAPAQAKPNRKMKPLNVSAPVAQGGMPKRVHVSEDFDTDIERRW